MTDLSRLFEHMCWADQKILNRLAALPEEARDLRLIAHVLASERVWLARLEGRDTATLKIWPELTLEQCRAEAGDVHTAFGSYVRTIEDATAVVTYRNTAGVEYTTGIADILTHVFLHGSYHRGQIARDLRRSGYDPVNTDFIRFVREVGAATPAPDPL